MTELSVDFTSLKAAERQLRRLGREDIWNKALARAINEELRRLNTSAAKKLRAETGISSANIKAKALRVTKARPTKFPQGRFRVTGEPISLRRRNPRQLKGSVVSFRGNKGRSRIFNAFIPQKGAKRLNDHVYLRIGRKITARYGPSLPGLYGQDRNVKQDLAIAQQSLTDKAVRNLNVQLSRALSK